MFNRTTINAGGPSHVEHTHHAHLAPTAEHLKLLQEYQQEAREEAKQAWFAGNLHDIGFGEVHVRRYRHEARKSDHAEVSFKVAGTLHQFDMTLDDDEVRNAEDYGEAVVGAMRRAIVAYLTDRIVLDRVLGNYLTG